jgi:branched-subunit amino acid ABC-type transport system permease component
VGANFQLFGFIVVSMGGFGSITGAFLGGLIMGVVDTFTGVYLNTAFKYLGVCLAFIVIVSFRPKGIFGR